jgi:hypothetical protein
MSQMCHSMDAEKYVPLTAHIEMGYVIVNAGHGFD